MIPHHWCMYSVQMIGANPCIDETQVNRNHTHSSAEELWRFTLLKYYKPHGKHSSARTAVMTPSSIERRATSLPLALRRRPLWVSTGVLEWPFWTKLIVVAIGFTGGLIFMYIQCKVYLQLWRRLKAFNRVITVQNCPEKGLHSVQARTGPLANGRHEAVEVPASAPVPAQEAQTDSDMSVEAAVAPAQNPVWLNCEEVEEDDAKVKIICDQPSGRELCEGWSWEVFSFIAVCTFWNCTDETSPGRARPVNGVKSLGMLHSKPGPALVLNSLSNVKHYNVNVVS